MGNNVRMTEYLEIDADKEMWVCHNCNEELISARENYKKGCLVIEKSPEEIFPSIVDAEHSFSADPEWCRYLEFCCPNCGTLIEVEVLPPGHPITHDIEPDLDDLRKRFVGGKQDER